MKQKQNNAVAMDVGFQSAFTTKVLFTQTSLQPTKHFPPWASTWQQCFQQAELH